MDKSDILFEKYYEDILRFLRGLSRDEHLAEELTQETIYRAISSAHTFRGDSDLRVWLCSGKIYVHEKEVGRDVDFAEDIGIIIETPGFLGGFNGYKNLEYLACIKRQIGKEEIRESMRLVGLDPDSKKKVKKYSLGMRQRLGIAQAIMEHPKFLILDEPMNGLDREGAAGIRALFLKLKEEGVTILLASHHREDIEELCDEVYEMEDGRLRKVRSNGISAAQASRSD